MTKVSKKRGIKKNTTKKHKNKNNIVCQRIYTPFEVAYGKTLPKDTYKQSGKKLIGDFLKTLKSEYDQSKTTAKNDFYTYINYRWLMDKEPDSIILDKRQKYFTQVDNFRIIQDNVYWQLYDIMRDYCKKNHNPLAKSLGGFYKSAINLNPISNSKKNIDQYIKFVDEMRKDNKNIWKLLGYINRNEIYSHGAPFVWSLNPDDKNSNFYKSYLSPHVFSLLDLNVYFDDGTDVTYKNKYRRDFINYVNLLFTTCLGKGHGLDPSAPFQVEQELFGGFCNEVKNDSLNNYNIVTSIEAMEKYNFNWEEFTKEIGFKTTPSNFVCSNLNYLKCGTDIMLNNWTSEKWRSYWIYIYLREVARISQKWLQKLYNFYGGKERGIENIAPPEVRSALYTSLPFNTFLTNEYVKKYEDSAQIDFFKGIVEDLRQVYLRIIKRNTWMEPQTKKYAFEKMKKVNIVIGSPKILQPDPNLDYKENEFLENLLKIVEWRLKRFISLEGKSVIDIPSVDWTQYPIKYSGSQAYTVNASYTPSKNGIYVNLGYIQPPFIDLENRGIEYNLAHLGFTLAHEMSHGLDDFGSQYDADGNLNDWWTEKDKKKFKAIQKDVIVQYNEWTKRDGIEFDASISVGEDLADISGLAICEEYLRDFQKKNKDISHIRAISLDAFYTYFAYQQRQKITKKGLSAQLKTNPHPLDKYRTNVPLSRSDVFRARYNIKPGDDMYWHNTNTIW